MAGSGDFVYSPCPLCGMEGGEKIMLAGAPLVRGQFGFEIHPVICDCGLVRLDPRWSGERYGRFYQEEYDALYRLETKPDYGIEGVRRNMAEVWKRVRPHIPAPRTVLDAGCGSGHGLAYLADEIPGVRLFGIEASPECRAILAGEVGAEVIDHDLDGGWSERFAGRFDLIVMRHVVEHLLDPVASLSRIMRGLSETGAIYIAVPDMMHPRTVLRDYDKWWEYWFRAVHPFYYCRETLFALLEKAGLAPFAFGEENEEVWCLVRPGSTGFRLPGDLRTRQLALLARLLPASDEVTA